ncbi:MAG: hypothetical protein M3N34_02320 [Pseudomonadota bacterium]|nr:hypothetical protein [Pseudomonadota bacterium]
MSKQPASVPAAAMIQLALTTDEAEMLIDALEVDHEGYVEAVKEARGNNNRDDVKTFSEAATRIQGLMAKIQELIGGE